MYSSGEICFLHLKITATQVSKNAFNIYYDVISSCFHVDEKQIHLTNPVILVTNTPSQSRCDASGQTKDTLEGLWARRKVRNKVCTKNSQIVLLNVLSSLLVSVFQHRFTV